ncbi:hypothetical protein DBR06_SOUSAS20510030, partial [Sousa chinensis]
HRIYCILLSTSEGSLFPRSCSGAMCPNIQNSAC